MNAKWWQGLTVLDSAVIFALSGAALASPAKAAEKTIANFGIVAVGRNPQAALTLGADGAYYGTTTGGGATGNGAVFRLVPPAEGGSAWTRSIIYSFHGAADGSIPSAGLLLDASGALLGLTASGGAQGNGTAFKLTPPAAGQQDWTETTLHSFDGTNDGTAPFGTLVADGQGNFYGSTEGGGASFGGVVFELSPPAAGGTAWSETALYTFQGGTDGISPSAGLFRDAATGALFGMTALGGLNGEGEIYRLEPPAAGATAWAKTALYSFRGITDGNFPVGALVRGQNGEFLGVTNGGGLSGSGTVFSLAPPAPGRGGWLETVIYHFTGRLDGGSPSATPVMGPDGTLFGATNGGGSVGSGAVFALTPPARGRVWTETALASFNGSNGLNPSGLTLDASGFLIGTTVYGGTLGNGGGTVFTLTPPASGASGWTQAVVSQFPQTSATAAAPVGALLAGPNGVLFGNATSGGAAQQGAVFELTPPATGETAWHQTLLHSFAGKNGANPTGKLLSGPSGVLYGITTSGGPDGIYGLGTVFALLPPAPGHTQWTEQILHAFTGVPNGDGAYPAAGLIADAAGALYGTAGSGGNATSDNTTGNGVIYKLTPPAAGQGPWTETVLYRFSGPDGSAPQGSLVFDAGGALYGTTYTGGAAGEGTVFKLVPPQAGSALWTQAVLHSFDASTGGDGAIPGMEQLVLGHDGALFGTASQGGASNVGIVFKLAPPAAGSTAWAETVLHSFNGTDGANPYVGLLPGAHGVLYGVTEQGGTPPGCQSPFGSGCGTVFSLSHPSKGVGWTLQVLHDFAPTYGSDGSQPASALIRGRNGDLFGTTVGGGFGGGGIAFEITP